MKFYQTAFLTLASPCIIMGQEQLKSPQGDAERIIQPPTSSITINSRNEIYMPVVNKGSDGYAEGPPWIKPGGMRSYYLSTSWSKLVPSTVNLADENTFALDLHFTPGTTVSCPLSWWNGYRFITNDNDWQWKRNYNAICTSHSYNVAGRGNVVVGFFHGENKNEQVYSSNNLPVYYQNTVRPETTLNPNDPSTFSGTVNGKYVDCDEAYYAFVGLSWTDDTQDNNWGNAYYAEQGPIAWPSNGYLTASRAKASYGMRHPCSIVDNGYVYVYMLDTRYNDGHDPEEGRYPGIKVVRAPINSSLDENAYQIYYNGGWVSSLPAGYSRTNMKNFLTTKGPKSTVITGDASTIHFAVAKVRDLPGWYVGVEERYSGVGDGIIIQLRLSQDLVHWTEPKVVLQQTTSYADGSNHYGIFMDQYGLTNTEIDQHKFFILGTKHTDLLSRLKLDITINTGSEQQHPCLGCTARTEGLESFQENGVEHVKMPERSMGKKIAVYNIFGQLIKQEVINGDIDSFDVDLNNFGTAGIYVLVVETENSRYTKKLVVSK